MCKISIIIPAYNNPENLDECLKAVHSSKPFEVIISKGNFTPASARNEGAYSAKGDILCFVDADVKVGEGFLIKLKDKFTDKVTAVQAVHSETMPVANFLSQYQNLYQCFNFRSTRVVSSFAFAIRKKEFFDIGGFDERVKKATIEDALLGLALYAEGYRRILAPDIQVEHLSRFSFGKLIKRTYLLGRDGAEYLITYRNSHNIWQATHSPITILSVFLAPICLVLPVFLPVFFLINIGFFAFLYKRKGLWFVIKSMAAYYVVRLVTFIGCVKGLLNAIFSLS